MFRYETTAEVLNAGFCQDQIGVMKLPRPFASTILVVGFFCGASLARAQVVFDNIGNANPYSPTVGWLVTSLTGPFNGRILEMAVQFTAGTTALLDYAELRLWTSSVGDTYQVSLLTDSGSNTPGAVIAFDSVSPPIAVGVSFPVVGPTATSTGGVLSLVRAEFAATPLLQAGTSYWLAVTPTNFRNGAAGWDLSGIASGLLAQDKDAAGPSDPWDLTFTDHQGGTRIFGTAVTAVPEPSVYGITSIVLIGMIMLRRLARSK